MMSSDNGLNLDATQRLRREMRPFLRRNDGLVFAAVSVDFGVYIAATMLAVIAGPAWLKIIGSIIAGTMISTLFVLGHDAAHGSLTSKRWLNPLLGRLLFLPSLHNYTLWLVQHNQAHHQIPNVKGANSWSPLALDEYRALPLHRRLIERIYRGGGTGVYYLIERWWKDKFFPRKCVNADLRAAAWLDFGVVVIWLAAFLALLGVLARISAQGTWLAAIFWGFGLPFIVWNFNMGLTVFLQHTHRAVPWFRTEAEARVCGGQQELTVHVKYPRWYGVLSHDIMEHPAHHINPMIPFYRLHRAQERLNEVLGPGAVVEAIGVRYIVSLIGSCKLYDYDRREWLDFSGRTTSQTIPALAPARSDASAS